MIFFKFISLSKIFVACILIISAMPSSAQQFRNRSTALSELWGFLVEACYPQLRIFKLIKGQKTPELYLFLKEAQGPDIPKYQHPPDQFQKIFENYTTSPIKNSYLGYCKLHNTSLPPPAIAWDRMILHIHKDNKVTGWILGSSETTYNTVRTSDDITDAFLGEVANNKIQFHRVTEEGKAPKDGREEYYLTWKPASSVIAGTWKGYSKNATPKKQEGNVHISIKEMDPSHSFSMHKAQGSLQEACLFDFFFYNAKELSKIPPKIEEKIKKCIKFSEKDKNSWQSDSDPYMRFPYIFNYNEQEQVIAFYINEAWEAYEPYLPEDIKKKKDEILTFKVNLKHQIHSSSKSEKNGNPLSIPMNFGKIPGNEEKSKEYNLNISTGTFFTDKVEDDEKFKSRVSLIAHEVLGHGIFFRYYWTFIKKESENLLKKCSDPTSLTEELKSCIEKVSEQKAITEISAETAIKEGLAVAVEYAVYQHTKKYVDIETFMKTRYSSEQAAIYRLGVNYLREQTIIEDGKLNFDKLNKMNKGNDVE